MKILLCSFLVCICCNLVVCQFFGPGGSTFCGETICGPCEDCVPLFPNCLTPWCPKHCQPRICPVPNATCKLLPGGRGECTTKLRSHWQSGGIPAFKFSDRTRTITTETQPTPLIPRSVLFLAPDRTSVQLSPDGKYLGFVAPVNRVPNILIQTVDDAVKGLPTQVPVTFDRAPPGIRTFAWTYIPGILVYSKDNNGDENTRLYKVNTFTRRTTLLAGTAGAQVKIVASHHNYPQTLIVGINNRNKTLFDLYTLNITDGSSRLLLLNNFGYSSFLFDNDLKLRIASRQSSDGGPQYYNYDSDTDTWSLYRSVSFDDELTTKPIMFDSTNKYLYWSDSSQTDKTRLIKTSFDGQEIISIIYAPTKSDIGPAIWHPTKYTPLAVTDDYDKPKWIILDESVRRDINRLEQLDSDAYPFIQGGSLDNTKWLIMQVHDNQVQKFYFYNRITQTLHYLFSVNQAIGRFSLAKMHSVEVTTKDQLTEVCYLSLPPESDPTGSGRPIKPLPMVLKVHGGPWLRDLWGFNQETQLLSNRGYAVLQCNFRSSTGYGKKFINAGNGEWGKKMQQDLLDAVNWAVRQRVADPKRVAIYGGSYGGYAALAGLAFTPNIFACGIDVVGPSNLVTLMEAIPPTWRPYYNSMKKRIGGDPETADGKKFLESRSPLFYATNIKKPLLIAQGSMKNHAIAI